MMRADPHGHIAQRNIIAPHGLTSHVIHTHVIIAAKIILINSKSLTQANVCHTSYHNQKQSQKYVQE